MGLWKMRRREGKEEDGEERKEEDGEERREEDGEELY